MLETRCWLSGHDSSMSLKSLSMKDQVSNALNL